MKGIVVGLSICSFLLGAMTAERFNDFRRVLTGYAYFQGMCCEYITEEPSTWPFFLFSYALGVLMREIVMLIIF